MHIERAAAVWLLGASTGGHEAVIRFLKQVPVDIGLGFVYAQHIDGKQMGPLRRILEEGSGWWVKEAHTGDFIKSGQVTLISAECETRISKNGQLLRFTSPWREVYSPSVNQLAKRIALVYRQNGGVIVFTGMGDDGVKGCAEIRSRGGSVWVQDPKECLAVSMPNAVINSGAADFVAGINDLATAITTRYSALEVDSK